MNELEQFLDLPNIGDLTEEIFVSERLGKMTIKAMSADEFSDYQKRATPKTAKKARDIDAAKFNLLVAAGQVIKPDFSDAEFLAKVGCASAEDFIRRKFLVGEITTIASAVSKLSGFTNSFEEDVEEAKN